MKKIMGLFLTLTLLLCNSLVFAATDISGGTIVAEGIGAAGQLTPLGYRAATLDAYRQLLEETNGAMVTADTTVENMVVTNDVIRSRVSGLVKGAKVISKTKDSEGFYHVVVELPVFGGIGSLAEAVIPQVPQIPFKAPSDIIPVKPQTQTTLPQASAPQVSVPQVAPPQVSVPTVTTTTTTTTTTTAPVVQAPTPVAPAVAASGVDLPAYGATGNYTGVVVDCTGMGLQSAMAPAVFTPDHKVVYGLENFNHSDVISHGYVGYAKSMSAGLDRAGSNPLVVRAVSIDRYCSPVVAEADAAKILAENQVSGFLAKGNMVFVK